MVEAQKSVEQEKTKLEMNYEELERDKMVMEEANREHLQSVQESLNRVLTDCEGYREEVEKKRIELENMNQKAKTYE